MPCQDRSAGEQKAPSHGLSASFGPPGLDVPHCHVQPGHVSPVIAAAQELLISYGNAQVGDGEILVTQEIFLWL